MVCTTLLVAGCADPDPPSAPVMPSAAARPQPALTFAPAPQVQLTHPTPPQNCTDQRFPYPLTVQAESTAEISSLTLIDACTNQGGTATYLRNRSELVWRIYAPPPATVNVVRRTLAQAVLVDATRDGRIMGPKSEMVATAGPGSVRWYADPSLTATYASIVELEKSAIDKAVDKSPSVLRDKSRARAHLTCAVVGYGAATSAVEVSKAASDSERTQKIAEGVQSVVTGVGGCRDALQAADAEQVRSGRIAAPVLAELDSTPLPTRLQLIARPVEKTWPVSLRSVIQWVKRIR